MTAEQIQWLVSQGIGVASFVLIAIWFGKSVWPDIRTQHREGLAAMKDGFDGLGQRVGGMEAREKERIKLGWVRELREGNPDLTPEEALRKATEILGNGSH